MTSIGELSERARRWAETMGGYGSAPGGVRRAHASPVAVQLAGVLDRAAREEAERHGLAPSATRALGGGNRPRAEEADPWRTCFERDRDRILHDAAFRRLAGKTQVFVFPLDHQRTRLTHALEVAQVARAIASALRLNVPLAEAVALAHDCGHGPFGHASEDALDPLVPGGFDHAPWGADITLAHLNLTAEVSDGIRNHSWSRSAPVTPEGEVVALADRIAYTTHDAEDAARAGIVDVADLPPVVRERVGEQRSRQLDLFITDVVTATASSQVVAMSADIADALGALRAWNYERIYLRPESLRQATMVHALLRALVEHYVQHPSDLAPRARETDADPVRAAVAYVAGMTDRFACSQGERLLDWPRDELPAGFDV